MKSWKGVIGLVSLLIVSVAYGEDSGDKTVVEPDATGGSYRTPEQARSKLNERGIQYIQSSFFDRVEKGDLFAVQLFMDAGMAIHARTDHGETALMVAAGEGHVEMVQLLVDNGTDINAQTGSGRTALMVAAGEGHVEVGRFLVDNGADINAEDKNGWTALDLASWGGDPKIGIAHVEVVRSLVERWVAKAGANARTEDGKTALHWAVLSGDLAMVRFLVANGADINAQSKYG
ncbi:MAG: ankyrin repeat domain-containing protein [Gemmatimonadetes bacterium]|nr:ankyrin repeat domain-containing protein [Gemmatimonadota bacterium]